ncbi:hypothetical protein [Thioflexithrix psekupsensis]|uniref:Uncharacterized protein n=1 Tax=Thioflexithrix psekupsensis TaxID=1570016 RepID=A0A251X8L5_9GAMM|nr:hypothetical protein [Thioflexithrix psekupsensis]OUD14067.1 hypothetical protein TPSD3_06935 [Thioflexithrix psekupsensis]
MLTRPSFAGDFLNSIHLLNDFCADMHAFSYKKLAALRLKGLLLNLNICQRELLMVIGSEADYKTLIAQLEPHKRLYQLLALHFKKVKIAFGLEGESANHCVLLEERAFMSVLTQSDDLRDMTHVGARFRRALNIAMQGHICVLRLQQLSEIEQLKQLWKRDRIQMLMQKYHILTVTEPKKLLVKVWKSVNQEMDNEIAHNEIEGMMIFID